MGASSKLEKPKLERVIRKGPGDTLVEELTPESEHLWTQYLRNQTLAKIAMKDIEISNED